MGATILSVNPGRIGVIPTAPADWWFTCTTTLNCCSKIGLCKGIVGEAGASEDVERHSGATHKQFRADCSERSRLVVLGIGGQWSSDAAQFLRMLTRSRARSVPVRPSATAACLPLVCLALVCCSLRCGSQPPFPPVGKRCQRRRGGARSQRCPSRDLLCSTAAPASLAVSRGFLPAVDLSCLGRSPCATGRLGVWLLVMPRAGTADWPEKVRQKK